jgi:hypothetical protein
MEEWADLVGRVLRNTRARVDHERHDLDRCLAAVRGLSELTLDGKAVGYRVAGSWRSARVKVTRTLSRRRTRA